MEPKAIARTQFEAENETNAVRKSEFAFYPAVLLFLLASAYGFGGLNELWTRPWDTWFIVYLIKTIIEIIASGFAVFYVLVALAYSRPASPLPSTVGNCRCRNISIAYLCCEDIDREALSSVVRCGARNGTRILVHDDSNTIQSRKLVDALVGELETTHSVKIEILRRPDRVGGKPGAVNNILQSLPAEVEFLLLCDNDSFLPETGFLDEALCHFKPPEVAIVQFRNLGFVDDADSSGYRTLSISVDFYDTFVCFLDHLGFSPFLGHNALLRVSAMREVGGFTPNQLSDDIDYSVRLRLKGYKVLYAREFEAKERHPLYYQSLRKRTEKWAFGCTQILMNWTIAVIKSRLLSPMEKTTFFLTVGFYHFQLLLLVYLTIFYFLLPFHPDDRLGSYQLVVSAVLILFLTFVPSITYFFRNGRISAWPKAALCWGLTYGSQDFVILRAICKCLFRRELHWSPTNGITSDHGGTGYMPEIFFAMSILIVATYQQPELLMLPTTLLFAGKFLSAPFLDRLVFYKSQASEY